MGLRVRAVLRVAVVFSGLLGGEAAQAITVTNFDFEASALSDGAIAIGVPSGWTTSGGTQGTYNPSFSFYNNAAITDPPNSGVIGTMSGARVGFLFTSPGAFMTNTTTYNVVVGETYALTVAIGDRTFGGSSFGAVLTLLDGDSVLASQTVSSAPTVGSFGDATLTYTAVAGDGGALRIRLGQSAAANYADFDNVRLNVVAASVPEPAHVAVAGLGMLAYLRRRRLAARRS